MDQTGAPTLKTAVPKVFTYSISTAFVMTDMNMCYLFVCCVSETVSVYPVAGNLADLHDNDECRKIQFS